MGVTKLKAIRARQLCEKCVERFRQDGPLCRTCANIAGKTATFERDRLRAARAQARIDALRPASIDPGAPVVRVLRDPLTGELTEFEVWNGHKWSWEAE